MEKSSVGKRIAWLVSTIVAAVLVGVVFAGQPESYKPPYTLSLEMKPDPVRGCIRTPYRTLFTFTTKGKADQVAAQILGELKQQGFRWTLKRPSGQDESYHIDNPIEPERAKAEGLTVYADPSDPSGSIVMIYSPLHKPSKMQIWWYGTSKWIRRDDSLL